MKKILNKLLQFWKFITLRYIKVKQSTNVTLLCINEGEVKGYNEFLGISEERREELTKLIDKTILDLSKDDKTEPYIVLYNTSLILSKECKHQNELAYVTYLLGIICNQVYNSPIDTFLKSFKI